METKPAAGQIVYEDFVPSYKLVREEGIDTIIVELAEFKREQIGVQLDKFGNLSITGERPLADSRSRRFHSIFQVPEECNEIRAKFENGRLSVKVLPKLIIETSLPAAVPKKKEDEKGGEPIDTRKDAEKVGEKEKDQIEEKEDKKKLEVLEPSLAFPQPMEVPVNVIVAILVLVVIALYVTFKQ